MPPLTPNSSATAFATAQDMINFYDERTVGDLVDDTDTQVPAGSLAGNGPLLAALGAASGRVESACVAGGRYAPSDLANLTGVSAQYLKLLVCDLAFGTLRKRRGLPVDDEERAKASEDALKRLHDGEAIFSFVETESAGLPVNSFFDECDLQRLNLVSIAAQRALGMRVNRRPRY